MSSNLTCLDGEGEGGGPLGNLLLEVLDLLNLARGDLGLEVLELVVLLGEIGLDRLAELDGRVNVAGDALEVILTHATRSHGRGTNSDTARGQGRLVSGGGVLVAGNVDLLEDSLNTGTVKSLGLQVDEDHVVVGTASDKGVVTGLELVLKSLGVLDDLLLVLSELVGLSLLEGNSKSSNRVVVRTTLVTREDREVDGALEVVEGLDLLASLHLSLADTLAEEDHGTTGTTERLVGGGGDNVGVGEGRVVDATSDQTGNVGHVDHEVAADLVANLAEALVVNGTAVGRGTGDDDLGSVHEGVLLELVVVNDASLEVDTVGEGLEVGGNSRDPEVVVREAFMSLNRELTYFLWGVW